MTPLRLVRLLLLGLALGVSVAARAESAVLPDLRSAQDMQLQARLEAVVREPASSPR